MKQMIRTLNAVRKSNPREFWGGVAAVTSIFGMFNIGLWAIAILQGRV